LRCRGLGLAGSRFQISASEQGTGDTLIPFVFDLGERTWINCAINLLFKLRDSFACLVAIHSTPVAEFTAHHAQASLCIAQTISLTITMIRLPTACRTKPAMERA
jgi:hypothetical protein